MSKPNKEVIRKWVRALRSGAYKQAKGYLRVDTIVGAGSRIREYCCLGVLCNLFREEHPDTSQWGYDQIGQPHFITAEEGGLKNNRELLPYAVSEWAGLGARNPIIQDLTLSSINDRGASFEKIADLIEKNFLSEDEDEAKKMRDHLIGLAF